MAKGRIRRAFGRARGSRLGRGINVNAIMAGGLTGAALPYTSGTLNGFGGPLTLAAGGVMFGNETLQTLAALQMGARLTSGMPGATAPNGGFLIG